MGIFDEFHQKFGKVGTEEQVKKDIVEKVEARSLGDCQNLVYRMIEEIIGREITREERRRLTTIMRRAVALENGRLLLEKVAATNQLNTCQTMYKNLEKKLAP